MKQLVVPVIQTSVRKLCCCSYPNHPKGCPNFGKKATCPPAVKCFEEVFNMAQPFYAIWTTFPFGEHVAKMKAIHPDWSSRQLECCLYWQGTARKKLKTEIARFKSGHPNLFVTTCPEAMGVNVTATMAKIGEQLEWPPKNITYQVAIAGSELADIKR